MSKVTPKPCPNCGEKFNKEGKICVKVVSTKESTDNRLVRRKLCRICKYRWYTVQDPESFIHSHRITYRSKYISEYRKLNIKQKVIILSEDEAKLEALDKEDLFNAEDAEDMNEHRELFDEVIK